MKKDERKDKKAKLLVEIKQLDAEISLLRAEIDPLFTRAQYNYPKPDYSLIQSMVQMQRDLLQKEEASLSLLVKFQKKKLKISPMAARRSPPKLVLSGPDLTALPMQIPFLDTTFMNCVFAESDLLTSSSSEPPSRILDLYLLPENLLKLQLKVIYTLTTMGAIFSTNFSPISFSPMQTIFYLVLTPYVPYSRFVAFILLSHQFGVSTANILDYCSQLLKHSLFREVALQGKMARIIKFLSIHFKMDIYFAKKSDEKLQIQSLFKKFFADQIAPLLTSRQYRESSKFLNDYDHLCMQDEKVLKLLLQTDARAVHLNPAANACDLPLLAENITLIDYLLTFGLTRDECADEADPHVRKILYYGTLLSQWMEHQVYHATPENHEPKGSPHRSLSTASLSTSSSSNKSSNTARLSISSSTKSSERTLKEQATRVRLFVQLSREFLRLNNMNALFAFHQFAQRCLYTASQPTTPTTNLIASASNPILSLPSTTTIQGLSTSELSNSLPHLHVVRGTSLPRTPQRLSAPAKSRDLGGLRMSSSSPNPRVSFANVLGLKDTRKRNKEAKKQLVEPDEQESERACLSDSQSSLNTTTATSTNVQQAAPRRTLWDFLDACDREQVRFVSTLFQTGDEEVNASCAEASTTTTATTTRTKKTYRNYHSYYAGLQSAPKICCYAIELEAMQEVNTESTFDHYGNISLSKFRRLFPLSTLVLSMKEASYRVVRSAKNGRPIDLLVSSDSVDGDAKREKLRLRDEMLQFFGATESSAMPSRTEKDKEKVDKEKPDESRSRVTFQLRQNNDILGQFCPNPARPSLENTASRRNMLKFQSHEDTPPTNLRLSSVLRARVESDSEATEEDTPFFQWAHGTAESISVSPPDDGEGFTSPNFADDGWASLSRNGR